jgi:hypothetical protein
MRWISSKTGAYPLGVGVMTVAIATAGWTVVAERPGGASRTGTNPVAAGAEQGSAAAGLQSIGPLAFGPDGVLFAADRQGAAIYAIDLGQQAGGGQPGAKDVAGIDQQIAGMLGTDAKEVQITDLAVHPKTRNAYISVMRGTGADAKPALLRVDGAGKISVVTLDGLKLTKAVLPNAPNAAAPGQQRNPRMESITDMAFVDGKLVVAGLSSEEFASKLRTIAYPFASVEAGTSVEIYHGNHGAYETRSPVISFVPYKLGNTPHLIAGYTCTPLVKFPVSSLAPGAKVMGTTIAELGNRNRPTDMIVYSKGGKDYLLIANTSRGVMKVATDGFATAPGITARVASETGGVGFEPVTSLKGVEQLDRLDDQRALVLARAEGGALSLQAVALP